MVAQTVGESDDDIQGRVEHARWAPRIMWVFGPHLGCPVILPATLCWPRSGAVATSNMFSAGTQDRNPLTCVICATPWLTAWLVRVGQLLR